MNTEATTINSIAVSTTATITQNLSLETLASSNGFFWPQYFGASTVYSFWLIFGPLTIMGAVGNILVVIAVLTCRKMRKSAMNVLMTNLAIADAGNLLMSTPDWMLILINRAPAFTLPPIVCTICRYVAMVSLYVSILTQVAICAERYVATLYPLHVHEMCSRVKINIGIVIIWTLALTFAIPNLQYSVLIYESSKERIPKCSLSSAPNQYFKIAELNIFYLIPLVLLIVLYSRIAKLLWATPKFLLEQPARKMTNLSDVEKVSMASVNSTSVMRTLKKSMRIKSRHMDNQSIMKDYVKRLNVRRRVVIMLVVCVSIYFICYSPIQILFLTAFVGHGHRLSFVQVLTLNALCYANSACNPVVYTVFSERFRARILYVLSVMVSPFGIRRISDKYSEQSRRATIFRPVDSKCREARLSASLWPRVERANKSSTSSHRKLLPSASAASSPRPIVNCYRPNIQGRRSTGECCVNDV